MLKSGHKSKDHALYLKCDAEGIETFLVRDVVKLLPTLQYSMVAVGVEHSFDNTKFSKHQFNAWLDGSKVYCVTGKHVGSLPPGVSLRKGFVRQSERAAARVEIILQRKV